VTCSLAPEPHRAHLAVILIALLFNTASACDSIPRVIMACLIVIFRSSMPELCSCVGDLRAFDLIR
jgi:hypothetical protein